MKLKNRLDKLTREDLEMISTYDEILTTLKHTRTFPKQEIDLVFEKIKHQVNKDLKRSKPRND